MSSIKLFETKKVRTHWDSEKEQWLFSVIDVVEILTNSSIPKRYWSDLKKKLQAEGSEVYEKIVRLKLEAPDGKLRETENPSYSYLNASIGLSPAALRAGYQPKKIPIAVEKRNESTMD